MPAVYNVSFDSVEEAARGSRASADVLALDESPDGRWAIAVVDKGRPGEPYLLQVICERHDDGWRDYGLDSNGYGYTALPQPPEPPYTGVVTCWGEAPGDAPSVVIRWQGREIEVAVTNGWFLFVAWDVPDPSPEELELPERPDRLR